MHVIINRIHFGNFRFILELEAGPAVEPGQLTLWMAEKIDIHAVPLSEFRLEQLLYAVKEPLRAQLYMQLEMEKQALQQAFQEKHATFFAYERTQQKRVGERTGNKTRDLRRQQEKLLLQLEQDFRQNELLKLEQTAYNLETLQAESHIFSEERFLRHFKDNEVNDSVIRQFCFQFAFDPVQREKVLAETARLPQPAKPFFE